MNNIIFKTLLLKGEAGNDIQSVEKTATSGLVDTYTITLTDGSTTTFDVTNGKGIVSFEKTASVGHVDTFTITYNDGTTDTFDIDVTVDGALSDSSTNPVENRVITENLEHLKNRYLSVEKKVLLFSDSYGTADGAGGWCSKVADILTNIGHSVSYVANSGYGFVGNDGTFISEITTYANGLSPDEKTAITDVVIGGGWNDSGKTAEDITQAIDECLAYCKATFPNAKIWVSFMAFDTQYSVLADLMNYVEPAYKKATINNGCFYMTNTPYITHDTNSMVDTRHPNSTGYSRIANIVSQYLIQGEANADLIRIPMNVALVDGISSQDNNSYQHSHNAIVESYISFGMYIDAPNGVNLRFDNEHRVKIADVKGCVVGDPLGTVSVDVPAVCVDGSNLIYSTLRFIIDNNELFILPLFTQGTASNADYTVTKIYLPIVIKFITNMTIS